MNVTFREVLAGVETSYSPGKVYDLDDEKAAKWIAAGLCQAAEQPKPVPAERETKAAPPERETKSATPKRETKTRQRKAE